MKKTNFIHLAVVALALLFCTPADAQVISGKRGSEDFKLGVAGYTFRKFNLDETIKMLQTAGVKYLSVKDFHLPLNSSVEQMNAFKQKLAAAGIDGYTLGPIYMKSKAEVDNVFEYAKRYGATLVIGVPNYDLLPYVEEKVKQYNIRLAIHTHGPDNAPFPDAEDVVNRVKDMDARLGVCLDIGHTVRFGKDNVEHFKKYKDRIFDIHIKDETAPSKAGSTCEMGRGIMDITPIVKTLRKIGYTGVCSLEFEKDADNPFPGVVESLGYFRGVCDATK